ncbi:BglG family transcription antiterminator [Bacillus cereus]|uniref:BglG family transcription antiterminator n=1 Tax=Bacillus cereus TaxID=1396 RepID=UPI000C283A23|nr:helix-turn-helix domain-containing protein [Bacillus cereus]
MEKEIYRQIQILDIIASENRWFTTEELAQQLHCSEKTIRKDVRMLTSTIPDEWNIKSVKGRGIFLQKLDNVSTSMLHSLFIETTLSFKIFNKLFNEQLQTLSELADKLYIHPSSLYKVLIRVEEELAKFQLDIQKRPLRIHGWEMQIRLFYYNFFFNIYGMKDWPFYHCDFDDLLIYTKEIHDSSEAPLSPESKQKYTFLLAITIKRIQQGHIVEIDEHLLLTVKKNYMFQVVSQMCSKIQQDYNITIPTSEQVFLTLALTKCHFLCPDRENVKERKIKSYYEKKLSIHCYLHSFIELLEAELGETLQDDAELLFAFINYFEKIELIMKMPCNLVFQFHQKTDLYIQNTYPDTYTSIQKVLKKLEKKYSMYSLSGETIETLTIQIQASLLRKRRLVKRIFVVTGEGNDWRQYLAAQIEQKFPQRVIIVRPPLGEVSDLTIQDYSIDFVVTDIPIEAHNVPVLHISTIPTQRDWETLYKYIIGKSALTTKKL